ncbi:MAG: hypothetical protein IIA09_19630 [Proteobacteria bacterium]|nr:hypothetical protein [Pseudomonadota bacterium]
MKILPPFGKQFQPVPRNGVQVAIGPGAWDFQKRYGGPIMVLPDDANPNDFRWPADGGPALIHERGTYDDGRLQLMAEALLHAGARSVVAIREALLDAHDPRVFFDKEIVDVAA